MRVIRKLLCACALPLVAATVMAQPYPNHPVRVISPTPAGTQPDLIARFITRPMGVTLNQSFVVENIPGSGGIAAINALMGSKPDGYTLIMLDASHWAINPATRANLSYDPDTSFTPIGLPMTSSLFLAVNAAVPAKSMAELIAYIRSKPGEVNYGSSGIGSVHHLTIEAFRQALSLNMLHVPYKGSSESVPAMVAGQVQMVVSSYSSIEQQAKAGRIRILAANTQKRSSLVPDIPAMAETVPGIDFPGQTGLVGPAGIPRDIVDKLSGAMREAIRQPEVLAQFRTAGVEPSEDTSPDYFAKRMRDDRVKYTAIIRAANIPIQ